MNDVSRYRSDHVIATWALKCRCALVDVLLAFALITSLATAYLNLPVVADVPYPRDAAIAWAVFTLGSVRAPPAA